MKIVDEREVLPSFASVQALLQSGNRGSALVLPGRTGKASAYWPTFASEAAGGNVPAWWSSDPEIHFSDVSFFRVRDAYYFPNFGVVMSSQGEVMQVTFREAAYLLSDVSGLPHVEQDARAAVLRLPAHVASIGRAMISFPWGANTNYGHFVLDCLPALVLARSVPELREYEYLFPPLQPWHRRHLELAGVEDFKELSGDIYRVEDAVFASCMDHFLQWPNDNLRLLRDIQMRNVRGATSTARRVYISRRGDKKRIFRDEEILERRLSEMRFAIIEPSQLPTDEQISVFSGADVVLGCTGAAFANVLYCQRSARIIEIQPTAFKSLWVRNICAAVGCHWLPFFCGSMPNANPQIVGGKARPDIGMTYDLEISALLKFVERYCA